MYISVYLFVYVRSWKISYHLMFPILELMHGILISNILDQGYRIFVGNNNMGGYLFFLVAKLLYKSKCPSVCPSTTFRGKRDFLGP